MTDIPLFNAQDPQAAMICGHYRFSDACTNVIGGTLTAGTPDGYNSALLTWAPPFLSAPTLIGTIISGGATTTSPTVRFSGVGVSNAYVFIGQSPLTNITLGIMIVGRARL